jgi:glycerol-3-phosphate O-acyltransferase
MRAYVVEPTNESGAAHLQSDKGEVFIASKDREPLAIARLFEEALQVYTIVIALLDADDLRDMSTECCDALRKNSILGHRWIVVDKDR